METLSFTTSTFLIGEKRVKERKKCVSATLLFIYGSICLPACACVGRKSEPTRPVTHSFLAVTLWTAEFNVGSKYLCRFENLYILVACWWIFPAVINSRVVWKTSEAYDSSSIHLFRHVCFRKTTVSFITSVTLSTRPPRPPGRILWNFIFRLFYLNLSRRAGCF